MKLPSGREFDCRCASFSEAIDLKNAVLNGINENSKATDWDLESYKNILKLDSNPVSRAALFKCLARCTINGEKVTQDSFDSAEWFGDYIPCVTECVNVNVSPFFAGLLESNTNGLDDLIVED